MLVHVSKRSSFSIFLHVITWIFLDRWWKTFGSDTLVLHLNLGHMIKWVSVQPNWDSVHLVYLCMWHMNVHFTFLCKTNTGFWKLTDTGFWKLCIHIFMETTQFLYESLQRVISLICHQFLKFSYLLLHWWTVSRDMGSWWERSLYATRRWRERQWCG